MRLKTELYLAASQEAIVLYNKDLPKKEFFNCEALTLEKLLKKCYQHEVEDDLICEIYFKEAVRSLIKSKDCFKHFQFSEKNLFEDSIELMYDFYIKYKLNGLKLEQFFAGDKKDDIELIFKEYEQLKNKMSLKDKSDLYLDMNKTKINSLLKEYDSIVIDWQFYEDEIKFIRSKKEQEIFDHIDSKKQKRQRKQTLEYAKNITMNKVFDFSEESKEAVKIAKTLLAQGVSSDEIVIVVSKIDDYKDSLKFALKEYDLKGYISTGVDFDKSGVYHELKKLKTISELQSFAQDSQQKLQEIDDKLKEQYSNTVNLGLKISKKALDLKQKLDLKGTKVSYEDIYDYISSSTKVEFCTKKDAVLIAEHNQVLKTKYKHIIYLGIDSTHLPQRFSENFLYAEEHTQMLHISNYYKDALYIYDRLKRNSENLHLIMASYQNKRELQPSSIIVDYDDKEDKLSPFKISQSVLVLNDLLDDNTQTKLDDETKNYILSKQLKKEDKYNGVLDLKEDASITFSASRLNEYSDCPLRYYFNYILKSKSPQDHSDDEFNAAEAGTLFHAVVEEFANDFQYAHHKNEEIDIESLIDYLYNAHYKSSLPSSGETVLHIAKKVELKIAIDRFKEYVEKGMLDNFEKVEEKFEFTMDGNKFTGFIDRIDVDEENSLISLIDYKTSKSEKNSGKNDSKFEKLEEYKEFQLPLYHFFIEQDEKYKKYKAGESYLLTFTGDIKKGTCTRFGQTNSSLHKTDEKNKIFAFNEEAKKKYKEKIKQIASEINGGRFYQTPSADSCRFCKYITMCGYGIKTEKKF